MRKLASVQRILGSAPIEGADRICQYFVQGWQTITQIGKFKEGDLAVFLEIDAVPPNEPVFAWLWEPLVAPSPSFRIRTKKLKGVISQGVLFAFSEFPDAQRAILEASEEGADVTELLGVKKYEIPIKLPGMGRSGPPPAGAFAADIPKTDEDRLQSIGTKILDELRGDSFYIVEKCDGTSATFAIDADGVFRVYSRNWEIKDGDNVYWNVARLHKIEEALRCHPEMALQGEIVGPGIQKNRLGLTRHELRAFTLYSKRLGQRGGQADLETLCDAYGIPMCEVLEFGTNFNYTQDDLLKKAEGKYRGTQNEREGIVVRPAHPKHSYILGGSLSFKVISNRFLLREED
jgi:RNA ligase (TIGR02306 family)